MRVGQFHLLAIEREIASRCVTPYTVIGNQKLKSLALIHNIIVFFSAQFTGDIDDCIVTPIQQTQFTPLTEAICDVIMDVTSHGQSATLEIIKKFLAMRFAHMQQPSNDIIYDTLVQLQQERKIYQTAKGYFIVTPE